MQIGHTFLSPSMLVFHDLYLHTETLHMYIYDAITFAYTFTFYFHVLFIVLDDFQEFLFFFAFSTLFETQFDQSHNLTTCLQSDWSWF